MCDLLKNDMFLYMFVFPWSQADLGVIAAVVEFDFEKQILAPVIVALAVEMQRRACASLNSSSSR